MEKEKLTLREVCATKDLDPKKILEYNKQNWSNDTHEGVTLITLYESMMDEALTPNYDKLKECAENHGMIPGVKVRVGQAVADEKKDVFIWVDVPNGGFSGNDIIDTMGRALQHTVDCFIGELAKNKELEKKIQELTEKEK